MQSAGEAKPTKKGRKLLEKEEKYAAATARRLKKEQRGLRTSKIMPKSSK